MASMAPGCMAKGEKAAMSMGVHLDNPDTGQGLNFAGRQSYWKEEQEVMEHDKRVPFVKGQKTQVHFLQCDFANPIEVKRL